MGKTQKYVRKIQTNCYYPPPVNNGGRVLFYSASLCGSVGLSVCLHC